MSYSSSNPEKERLLPVGSSSPKIFQATFPEAMRLVALFANSGGKLIEEYEVPDFITPDTQYFRLNSIHSNEHVRGVRLTREGHVLDVSDADYALYEGEARMNYPIRGKMVGRKERFMLMQYYLDAETYAHEKIKAEQEIVQKRTELKKVFSRDEKAS